MIERFILLRPSPGHVTQVFINIYRKSTEISNQSLKIAQTENLVTYQIFFLSALQTGISTGMRNLILLKISLCADAKGFIFRYWNWWLFWTRCITKAMNDPDETLNSVSKIDRISRWYILGLSGKVAGKVKKSSSYKLYENLFLLNFV